MSDDFIQRLRQHAQRLKDREDDFIDSSNHTIGDAGTAEYNAKAEAYRDALDDLKTRFPELTEDNKRYFVLTEPESVREIGIGGYSKGELIPVADPENGKLFLYRVEEVTELKDDRVVYHVKEEESFVQEEFDASKTTVFIKRSDTGRLVADSTPSMTRMLFKDDDPEGDLLQKEINDLLKRYGEPEGE